MSEFTIKLAEQSTPNDPGSVAKDAVIQPGKIVCVGRNYVDHIKELGNEVPEQMVLFLKPASAISSLLLAQDPVDNEPLHFETEICFLIKDKAISAVAVGLDLTKRQLQSELKTKGLPWERAKAFAKSALFSEFVPLNGAVDKLSLSLHIDGELQQSGGVELMMNSPAAILQEVDSAFGLQDGDIIMTGTPKGVGQVKANSEFVAAIHHENVCLTKVSWRAE